MLHYVINGVRESLWELQSETIVQDTTVVPFRSGHNPVASIVATRKKEDEELSTHVEIIPDPK